jgi:hypothetical protein
MMSGMDEVSKNGEAKRREPGEGDERSPDLAFRAAVRRYARLSGRRR